MYELVGELPLSFAAASDITLRNQDGFQRGVLESFNISANGDINGNGGSQIGTLTASFNANTLKGAKVTAELVGEETGPKLRIGKYSRRKGYRRTLGHRQTTLLVKVTGISG